MSDIFAGVPKEGWKAGWEPGANIFTGYEGEVEKIENKYDPNQSDGCTVFYGASNFRMWKNMDKDLAQFRAQNHGFGGATDVLLMHYAERILFPYKPKVVVVQSGSNDYMGLSGSPDEKADTSLALKKHMYAYFMENLPDTKFIALGALLMPGFDQATELSRIINRRLSDFCSESPRLAYVELEDLTFSDSKYRAELFKSDGIHLNRDGQIALCEGYILPALKAL